MQAILEARTERLDVCICEEIPAGDQLCVNVIADRLAHTQLLLVVLPPSIDGLDVDRRRNWPVRIRVRRLAIWSVLKFPPDPRYRTIVRGSPAIVDITNEQLHQRFPRPLFCQSTLTDLAVPLNEPGVRAIPSETLEQIRTVHCSWDLRIESFRGVLPGQSTPRRSDVAGARDFGNARVRAQWLCEHSQLSLQHVLVEPAQSTRGERRGSGTFWVNEMEQVIIDVARQNRPRVMTSTFRGRGQVAGQIFRPQLERVDDLNDTPVRFYFAFHEVLAPELRSRSWGDRRRVQPPLHRHSRPVGGAEPVSRCVLRRRNAAPSHLEINPDAIEGSRSGRVRTSLSIIEAEAERHNMIERGAERARGHRPRAGGSQLIQKRDWIRRAIEAAADCNNFRATDGGADARLDGQL